jgi:nucleoside triphosphate diphosphatase
MESLTSAKTTQENASALGFDWPDISGALDKVLEELREVEEAVAHNDEEHAKKELGDLLFAVINASRFLDADPVRELNAAADRFSCRFQLLQQKLLEQNTTIKECTVLELDTVWEQAKEELAKSNKNGLT